MIANDPQSWPMLVKVKDVCKITGFCKNKVYTLVQDEIIPMVKLRGEYVISRDTLEQWIKQL